MIVNNNKEPIILGELLLGMQQNMFSNFYILDQLKMEYIKLEVLLIYHGIKINVILLEMISLIS